LDLSMVITGRLGERALRRGAPPGYPADGMPPAEVTGFRRGCIRNCEVEESPVPNVSVLPC